MPNNLSIGKFQELSQIRSRTTAKELLNYLRELGIGNLSEDYVFFSEKDKLDTILLAMKLGCDPEIYQEICIGMILNYLHHY